MPPPPCPGETAAIPQFIISSTPKITKSSHEKQQKFSLFFAIRSCDPGSCLVPGCSGFCEYSQFPQSGRPFLSFMKDLVLSIYLKTKKSFFQNNISTIADLETVGACSMVSAVNYRLALRQLLKILNGSVDYFHNV